MSRVNRRKAKVDSGQDEAVKTLRKFGVSVRTGVDDFFCGYNGINLWVEWKGQDSVSKRTGEVLESCIQDDQKELRDTWKGSYMITHRVGDILGFLGVTFQGEV